MIGAMAEQDLADPQAGPGRQSELTLVLGMHRSGTSLCAHMLSLMGLDMTDAVVPDGSNPRGHWEPPTIVAAHDEILRLFARGWYDERHGFALPPGWWADPRVRRIRDRILAWLEPRLAGRSRIGIKDPRTARLLPMWHEILAQLALAPRFVLCIREPGQVMRSLAARDEIPAADSEYRWTAYNAHAVEAIGARPVCVLPYEDWFPAPERNLARLIRHLGLGWDAADPMLARAAGEIADSGLRHDAADAAARPHPASRQLHDMLCAQADQNGLDAKLREAAGLFIGFEQLVAPLQQAAEKLPELWRRIAEQEAGMTTLRAREKELEAALAAALPMPEVTPSGA